MNARDKQQIRNKTRPQPKPQIMIHTSQKEDSFELDDTVQLIPAITSKPKMVRWIIQAVIIAGTVGVLYMLGKGLS